MRSPAAWPVSTSSVSGCPSARASGTLLSVMPQIVSAGAPGSCIECRSSSTSAASTKGASSRARRNSTESRGPRSTASSQTRFMSSSTQRDANGASGLKRP